MWMALVPAALSARSALAPVLTGGDASAPLAAEAVPASATLELLLLLLAAAWVLLPLAVLLLLLFALPVAVLPSNSLPAFDSFVSAAAAAAAAAAFDAAFASRSQACGLVGGPMPCFASELRTARATSSSNAACQ
jgi:hypothetical protein